MDNRTPKRNKKRRKHLQKVLRKAQERLENLGPYERHMTLRRAQNAVYAIEEELARMDEHLFRPENMERDDLSHWVQVCAQVRKDRERKRERLEKHQAPWS